jgi:hypothetical protein
MLQTNKSQKQKKDNLLTVAQDKLAKENDPAKQQTLRDAVTDAEAQVKGADDEVKQTEKKIAAAQAKIDQTIAKGDSDIAGAQAEQKTLEAQATDLVNAHTAAVAAHATTKGKIPEFQAAVSSASAVVQRSVDAKGKAITAKDAAVKALDDAKAAHKIAAEEQAAAIADEANKLKLKNDASAAQGVAQQAYEAKALLFTEAVATLTASTGVKAAKKAALDKATDDYEKAKTLYATGFEKLTKNSLSSASGPSVEAK